jgi:ubiquitin-like protein Pup
MSEQEQIRKAKTERRDESVAGAPEVDATKADKGDQIKADLDELLDEIDEVLEDNAEEFVRNYVQKGGE